MRCEVLRELNIMSIYSSDESKEYFSKYVNRVCTLQKEYKILRVFESKYNNKRLKLSLTKLDDVLIEKNAKALDNNFNHDLEEYYSAKLVFLCYQIDKVKSQYSGKRKESAEKKDLDLQQILDVMPAIEKYWIFSFLRAAAIPEEVYTINADDYKNQGKDKVKVKELLNTLQENKLEMDKAIKTFIALKDQRSHVKLEILTLAMLGKQLLKELKIECEPAIQLRMENMSNRTWVGGNIDLSKKNEHATIIGVQRLDKHK